MIFRRILPTLVGVGSLLGLTLACFGNALFGGEQFAFRDAAHFYHPLYRVVQDEWAAGRVPLWDPWENGGMPLLGAATTAALYPGKLVYAISSYAAGTKLYAIGHVLLAFFAMYTLMRHWRTSRSGSTIAAFGYAFGAPVLFQYCNIIFLVGAAWTPLGLLAADRLVRLRRRRGIVELAAVLAMQVLGGDPESSYVLGVLAAGYAVAIAGRGPDGATVGGRRGTVGRWVVAAVLLAAWVGLTILAGIWLPEYRPRASQTRPMPIFWWTPYVSRALLAAWGIGSVLLVATWRHSSRGRARLACLGLLLGSAALAGLLAAAQLLPAAEFSSLTARAADEGSHEIYAFSVEPYRLPELLWPAVFGVGFGEESSWIYALPPSGGQKLWVPSLYQGGAVLVLALSAFGLRGGTPGRSWLSAIAAAGVLAAIGTYSSPLWYARFVPGLAEQLGPHDPILTGPVRQDGALRDGDGSFYWLLAATLPGFDSFRYPAKFLSYASLGIAGLAGIGWDRLLEGRRGRVFAIAGAALGGTIVVDGALGIVSDRFVGWIGSQPMAQTGGTFGPIDPEVSLHATAWALGHGASAMLALIALALIAPRRPKVASMLAVAALAVDLGVANARFVLTVPQELLDESNTPKVLTLIAEAEAEDPAVGPYRIHRMPIWDPIAWRMAGDPDRVDELVRWERSTIQPKYGLPFGVEYTHTEGTAELYDLLFFFAPFERTLRGEGAAMLKAEPGSKAVIYPRRGFDLWNTRYFVLPVLHPGGWDDERRGYASFLPETSPIYPDPEALEAMTAEQRDALFLGEDLQILRNEAAYPRAWVVHEVVAMDPIEGLDRGDRIGPMNEILHQGDVYWDDPELNVNDLRKVAWVEPKDASVLYGFTSGGAPTSNERVEVVSHEPQRVVLRADLQRPGLVVLADAFYPGWRLSIDGEPAEIIRTNRMMRGATVRSGTHELVYTYEPDSFRVGCIGTGIGLAALVGLLVWSIARPTIGGPGAPLA